VPYATIAELVIARYRAAIQRMDVLGPDAAASFELRAYAATLMDEYQSLVERASEEHQPPLPPFADVDAEGRLGLVRRAGSRS
jgi:hypothetical protein